MPSVSESKDGNKVMTLIVVTNKENDAKPNENKTISLNYRSNLNIIDHLFSMYLFRS